MSICFLLIIKSTCSIIQYTCNLYMITCKIIQNLSVCLLSSIWRMLIRATPTMTISSNFEKINLLFHYFTQTIEKISAVLFLLLSSLHMFLVFSCKDLDLEIVTAVSKIMFLTLFTFYILLIPFMKCCGASMGLNGSC